LTVHDRDKQDLLPVARRFSALGFELAATAGTADFLAASGLAVRPVLKVHEGRPHVVDELINGTIHLVVNTPLGRESHEDDAEIRRIAVKHDVPCITTLSGALAAAEAIASLRRDGLDVRPLQELHAAVATSPQPI
jgi:carbamoyl-phosphate synthase large subunit